MQYLSEVATSADRRYRLLAAGAAGRALDSDEVVISLADMQGGVLLERRGTPAKWGDAFTYMEAAMDVLAVLARDEDPEVANLATSTLIKAIHPSLQNDRLRHYLGGVVAVVMPCTIRTTDNQSTTDTRPTEKITHPR
ncbi:MAG: hypothetical protein ACRDRQ_16140 [Pseudonocardiaceae bacterium]